MSNLLKFAKDTYAKRANFRWGTPWEQEEVYPDHPSDCPEELKIFVRKWRSLIRMIPIKDNYFCCPIKWPWEIFIYKGVGYQLSSAELDCNDQFFEYMMRNYIEDALIGIGAEMVFCTAMTD